MAPKRPLDDGAADRILLRLDVLSDQLAEIEAELSGAYRARALPVKHLRRSLAALEASSRALDRTRRKGRSVLLDGDGLMGSGL